MKNPSLFVLGIIAVAALPAIAQRTYSVIPVLNCIFFDSASAEIPERYHVFSNPDETLGFTDSNLSDDALEIHRHTLNILGYRLRNNPELKVEIQGYNSYLAKVSENAGETIEISRDRGYAVFNYLRNIWGIADVRLDIQPPENMPERTRRSNPKDPLGNAENRRVDIRVTDPAGRNYPLVAPIVNLPAESPADAPVRTSVLFIRFEHDAPNAGPVNDRILKEHVYAAITEPVRIRVTGRTDVVGADDRNLTLSKQRARTICFGLRRNVSSEHVYSLECDGLGETDPIFTNALPEGRVLNRSVELIFEPVGNVDSEAAD